MYSLRYSFAYDTQRTFIAALQFAYSITQKLHNLVKEWGNIEKCLVISMCLMMDGFTLTSIYQLGINVYFNINCQLGMLASQIDQMGKQNYRHLILFIG